MQELFNQFNPVNLQAELERARMDDRTNEKLQDNEKEENHGQEMPETCKGAKALFAVACNLDEHVH